MLSNFPLKFPFNISQISGHSLWHVWLQVIDVRLICDLFVFKMVSQQISDGTKSFRLNYSEKYFGGFIELRAANIVALPVLVVLFIMLFDHILTMFGAWPNIDSHTRLLFTIYMYLSSFRTCHTVLPQFNHLTYVTCTLFSVPVMHDAGPLWSPGECFCLIHGYVVKNFYFYELEVKLNFIGMKSPVWEGFW